jgi:VanZ family protein
MEMKLAQRAAVWLPPFALMAVIFALSAQPHLSSGLGLADLVGRKVVHFLEYALLAFLWWRALRTRLPAQYAVMAGFALASLYAASDELHQSFVQGRHATPVDWAIDTAGAGAAAWQLARRGRPQRRVAS